MSRKMQRLAAVVLALLAWPPGAGAIDVAIDRAAIEEAIALARSRDEHGRERFHAPYRVLLGDPAFDSLEIVTEYRRVVLAAEQRVRLGDRSFGYREALEILRPWRGRLSAILRVTFHPQNVYRTVPAYELVLYPRPSPDVRGGAPRSQSPVDLRRTPRYLAGGGEVSLNPPAGGPMLGATVEAIFDTPRLNLEGTRLLGIRLDGRELRRVPVDFSAMR